MSAQLLYKMIKSKTEYPLHKAIKVEREDVVFLYLIEMDSQVLQLFFPFSCLFPKLYSACFSPECSSLPSEPLLAPSLVQCFSQEFKASELFLTCSSILPAAAHCPISEPHPYLQVVFTAEPTFWIPKSVSVFLCCNKKLPQNWSLKKHKFIISSFVLWESSTRCQNSPCSFLEAVEASPFPAHLGCWQNSVPCGYRANVLIFLLAIS